MRKKHMSTYVNSTNSMGHFIHVPSQSVHRLPELSDIFSTSGALRSCFRSHSTAKLAFTRSCRAPVKLLTSETTRFRMNQSRLATHFGTFSIQAPKRKWYGNDIYVHLQRPSRRSANSWSPASRYISCRRDWTLDRICLTFSGSVTVWRASDVVTRNPGKLFMYYKNNMTNMLTLNIKLYTSIHPIYVHITSIL